jgi:hypothetical protein
MKKQLPTHDDTPSVPVPPKKVRTGAPITEGNIRRPKHADGEKGTPLPKKKMVTPVVNNEGEVRQSKSGDTYVAKEHTNTQPRSKSGETYPIPDEDIDIYSIDTRIWDRIRDLTAEDPDGLHNHDSLYAEKTHEHDISHDHIGVYSLEGHTHKAEAHDHDGAYAEFGHTHDFPHEHDERYELIGHTHDFTHDHEGDYADAQAFADHLANHPTGDGSGGSYDDTEVRGLIETNANAIADLVSENNSQNENISANTTALAGKADTTHDHNEVYQPKGDYATNEALTQGLAGKANETHTHPAPTGFWGMWKGTQAEFDALSEKSDKTLYVVV